MLDKKLASENIIQKSDIAFHNKQTTIKLDTSFHEREKAILERIKKHYSIKLNRDIDDSEAKEIADNLLQFTQAIYG